MFGPTYSSEQCVAIEITEDFLQESWEQFTVQLNINSTNVDLYTSAFEVFINGKLQYSSGSV